MLTHEWECAKVQRHLLSFKSQKQISIKRCFSENDGFFAEPRACIVASTHYFAELMSTFFSQSGERHADRFYVPAQQSFAHRLCLFGVQIDLLSNCERKDTSQSLSAPPRWHTSPCQIEQRVYTKFLREFHSKIEQNPAMPGEVFSGSTYFVCGSGVGSIVKYFWLGMVHTMAGVLRQEGRMKITPKWSLSIHAES